jgi:hypothetical protein
MRAKASLVRRLVARPEARTIRNRVVKRSRRTSAFGRARRWQIAGLWPPPPSRRLPRTLMTSRSRTRRSIGAGARSSRRPFIAQQRNVVLVGGTGTGRTHLAIARSCIRPRSRGPFFTAVDLVNQSRPKAEPLTALEETAKTELLGLQEPRSDGDERRRSRDRLLSHKTKHALAVRPTVLMCELDILQTTRYVLSVATSARPHGSSWHGGCFDGEARPAGLTIVST